MHKKTLTSLVVLLCLTTLSMSQEEECGGPLSFKPFSNITAAIEYHSRCSYPTYKLNVSCILSSCPSLIGVCPLTSTGSVNQTGLNTAVSIFNTCLGQDGLICGINMTRNPMVQIVWTTAELIPSTIASGNISLNPGTGYVNNFSKTKITVNQQVDSTRNITLTIDAANIICEGNGTCHFNIPSPSLLNPLLPSSDFLHITNMCGIYNLNLTSTVSLDLSTQPPTFNTHVDQFHFVSEFTNFIDQVGVPLLEIAVTRFNKWMNYFFNKSVLPSTAANFLSTYAVLSLQAAQQNCP